MFPCFSLSMSDRNRKAQRSISDFGGKSANSVPVGYVRAPTSCTQSGRTGADSIPVGCDVAPVSRAGPPCLSEPNRGLP
jgi:hypothetical protein